MRQCTRQCTVCNHIQPLGRFCTCCNGETVPYFTPMQEVQMQEQLNKEHGSRQDE